MRNKFDMQLEQLNVELIKMGSLCEDAISGAAKALLNGDKSIIEQVVSTEGEIDQKEKDIESLCMKLLLQQQPVARDLRLISSALKMISDMERIGDQASDIAEITKFISPVLEGRHDYIGEMASATIQMVTESINSFVKKDLELAQSVIASDDIVDNLFLKVKTELIDLIEQKNGQGEYCLDLLMIAKYFERIGDHATNIAEWVEYSITGTHKGESI